MVNQTVLIFIHTIQLIIIIMTDQMVWYHHIRSVWVQNVTCNLSSSFLSILLFENIYLSNYYSPQIQPWQRLSITVNLSWKSCNWSIFKIISILFIFSYRYLLFRITSICLTSFSFLSRFCVLSLLLCWHKFFLSFFLSFLLLFHSYINS